MPHGERQDHTGQRGGRGRRGPDPERGEDRDARLVGGEQRRGRLREAPQRVAHLPPAHQERKAREDRVRVAVVEGQGGPVGAVCAVRLPLLFRAASEVHGRAREVGKPPHADLAGRPLHGLEGPVLGRLVVLRERREKLEPVRPVEAAGDRGRKRRKASCASPAARRRATRTTPGGRGASGGPAVPSSRIHRDGDYPPGGAGSRPGGRTAST